MNTRLLLLHACLSPALAMAKSCHQQGQKLHLAEHPR
ncbi:hypothetical protein J2X66_000058 [Pseudomonas sp. 3296]|nr:hypothetical protein [Pseudomonas sp. 3296]